jgi:hypothetical protein
MKNFLITVLILGMAAAGCGREHATSPVPQWHSWDQVVLAETHADAGTPASEVSVQSDGALTLVVGSGNAGQETVSSRGILSGEEIETLTGLVSAVPPSSFSSSSPCSADRFALTVTVRNAVRTYAFNSCDSANTAIPEAVRRLQGFLSGVSAATSSHVPKLVPVGFEVLLRGNESALHRPLRVVLQDRDALARFLREHSPDQPVAVPRVDFARQIVIAEWLGDRPTTEYTVDLKGAEITQTGWFRLSFQRFTPGNCPVATRITQPFVLAAVDRRPESMLFQDTTIEADCSARPPIRGGL